MAICDFCKSSDDVHGVTALVMTTERSPKRGVSDIVVVDPLKKTGHLCGACCGALAASVSKICDRFLEGEAAAPDPDVPY